MSDEYNSVARGPLKLKAADGMVKKKKNKKKRKEEEKKYLEQIAKLNENSTVQTTSSSSGPTLTKAEQSFIKMQEKRQVERIMEKASKSHKQRVEQFNRNLDLLTEHYDIPKVSWTK